MESELTRGSSENEWVDNYVNSMRVSFKYLPEALRDADSYHVWRGINVGYQTEGPIKHDTSGAAERHEDPLTYRDVMLSIPLDLPDSLESPSSYHLWRWMSLGNATEGPINTVNDDVIADSFVTGRAVEPANSEEPSDDDPDDNLSWAECGDSVADPLIDIASLRIGWEASLGDCDHDEIVAAQETEREINESWQMCLEEQGDLLKLWEMSELALRRRAAKRAREH